MTESHNPENRNTDKRNTDELLDRISSALDAAADDVDAATRTRLRAIRREALASADSPQKAAWWVPLGSLATVATLAVMTVTLLGTVPDENDFMPPLEDIALLSDKEELEFYEELDFYLWLDSEQVKQENTSDEQQTG